MIEQPQYSQDPLLAVTDSPATTIDTPTGRTHTKELKNNSLLARLRMSNNPPAWATDNEDLDSESALPPKSGGAKGKKKPEKKSPESVPLSSAWIIAVGFGAVLALTGLGLGTRHLYLRTQEKNRVAKAEADRIEAEAVSQEQAKVKELEDRKAAVRTAQEKLLADQVAAARKQVVENEQAKAAIATAEIEAERMAARNELEAKAAGKQERARLLADLDPAVAAELKAFDDMIATEEQNGAELQGQINKIAKNAARFPKTAARVKDLHAKLQSSVARTKSLSDERAAYADRS